MRFIGLVFILTFASIAHASSNRYELAKHQNAVVSFVVKNGSEGGTNYFLSVSHNLKLESSRAIHSGDYFLSDINNLFVEGNAIYELDEENGKVLVGELSDKNGLRRASLCTERFSSVCDFRLKRGRFKTFYILLK